MAQYPSATGYFLLGVCFCILFPLGFSLFEGDSGTLPLLLAFGMWWRVSLATPQDTLPEFTLQAPIVSLGGVSDNLEISEIKYSPLSLELKVSEEMIGKTLVFTQIPYHDTRFLELETENVVFVEKEGKTALDIKQAGLISIRVKTTPVIVSVVAAGLLWAVSGWILLKSRNKNNL